METKRRDSELEQWVLTALRSERHLQSQEICVHACNGVVTLCGSVADYSSWAAAEVATYGVAGVVEVSNRIQLRGCKALSLRKIESLALSPRLRTAKFLHGLNVGK